MVLSQASIWLILALTLAGAEMLSGTFYMLALAIGFACGSIAAWLGLSFALQTSFAAIVSIIAAIWLRRWKTRHTTADTATFLDIGQRVRVLEWSSTKKLRVQHRGSQWDAELAPAAEGGHAEYFIVAIHGATLVLHHHPPAEQA